MVGWMLLDTVRHVQSPADFAADEAREFGAVLQASMGAVRDATGMPRVYVVMFGEGAAHLHAHLIPRDPERADTKAWAVADLYRAIERHGATAATHDEVLRVTKRVGLAMSRAFTPGP